MPILDPFHRYFLPTKRQYFFRRSSKSHQNPQSFHDACLLYTLRLFPTLFFENLLRNQNLKLESDSMFLPTEFLHETSTKAKIDFLLRAFSTSRRSSAGKKRGLHIAQFFVLNPFPFSKIIYLHNLININNKFLIIIISTFI